MYRRGAGSIGLGIIPNEYHFLLPPLAFCSCFQKDFIFFSRVKEGEAPVNGTPSEDEHKKTEWAHFIFLRLIFSTQGERRRDFSEW